MASYKPPVDLIAPYGGVLKDLLVKEDERAELTRRAGMLASLQLSPRSLCDLELLATGAFSPLDRFMGRADYERVLDEMRLADGTLFPVPLTLPLNIKEEVVPGQEIALRNAKNNLLGWMRVDEIFEADPAKEALAVAGTADDHHPLVAEMRSWALRRISGPVRLVALPAHYDFPELRRTPAQVRSRLAEMDNPKVAAFQTHNPLHRADEELARRAAAEAGASLLVQPLVGTTMPGEVDYYTRVRIFKAVIGKYYDHHSTLLAILPLAMRRGPREALWQAIVARNFGATHFVLAADHATPASDSDGNPFHSPDEARDLLERHSAEIGVVPLAYDEMVYLPGEDRFEQASAVAGRRGLSISEMEVRESYLALGRPLPEWFTRRETADILGAAYPPRSRQGFCIWFTGLPSSGKSTVADILTVLLHEHGREVTVLDGDVVRTHLSKGLGFSAEDRDINIRRIGFVASEIVRHNGVVIGAAVSPYRATRNQVRAMMRPGAFIETFVDTPVDVCAGRDVKGFYARARAGEIKGFTGVDDPYEPPLNPEITLNTTGRTPQENAEIIIRYLQDRGFLARNGETETAEESIREPARA